MFLSLEGYFRGTRCGCHLSTGLPVACDCSHRCPETRPVKLLELSSPQLAWACSHLRFTCPTFAWIMWDTSMLPLFSLLTSHSYFLLFVLRRNLSVVPSLKHDQLILICLAFSIKKWHPAHPGAPSPPQGHELQLRSHYTASYEEDIVVPVLQMEKMRHRGPLRT